MSKRLHKNYGSILIQMFGARPVAYNPVLGEITNSATAGLFLSQLLYWWDKGKKKDWIFKSEKEMRKETNLKRTQQESAAQKWIELGVLEKKRAGIPATNHYKIDIDKLIELAKPYVKDPSLLIPANLIEKNNRSVRYIKQTITESPHRKSQENLEKFNEIKKNIGNF